MKTIITTLPIYNKVEKQCFERAKHATNKGLFAIVSPRHRLPSFQWLDDADGAATVATIELYDTDGTFSDITSYFVALPALAHDYFTYPGTTLKYLLPTGSHYLKIIMNNEYIYYSEWFTVDCVYDTIVDSFTNGSYDTFTKTGTTITSAINLAGGAYADSNQFSIVKDESLTFITFLTSNSGELPGVQLYSTTGGMICTGTQVLTAGFNAITIAATASKSDAMIKITNGDAANWEMSEIIVIRNYSTKYLIIDFHNDCDLGDIYYHGGFEQTLWFESEPLEMTFPQEEEGMKNGEGQFVRSFARQEKKHIARTKELPGYMVEVFNRMKLHNTVQLTDLLGDQYDVYNLEVDHEWLGDDKYYARINLTFDFNEAFVITGCCNDIT